MSTLGERLKKARKRKGLSQIDVFDAVGISNKSLSRYENNSSTPSPDVLMKLTRLYDVSGEYILGVSAVMGHSADGAGSSDNLIDMTDQRASAEKLISFISESPTMFHAAENISQKLINDGFEALNEWETWDLKPGGKYFTVRNNSSVIAFKIGGGEISGFNIFSSHSDSPMFKLKPNAEMETLGHYIRLNTEVYGGAILSSWLDRPLSIAGRVALNSGDGVRSALVNLSDISLVIPNVAIHFNRNVNEGYNFNPQVDTIPILGSLDMKGRLSKITADALGAKEKDILSAELFIYNKTLGTVWGNDGEFVSSPRLDDLQCAYAGLNGFLSAQNDKRVNILCVFDNEEVGSATKQGADSDFLILTAERIARALSLDLPRLLSQSFAISADNAHAVHPNPPEFSDATNQPYLNGGIVIKQTARQSYATDAVSDAILRKICMSCGAPVQEYSNRSNIRGGGTLGNISATRVSVPTVDIGLAQLAMHSSYETAGSMDTLYLERAAGEFFRSEILRGSGGAFKII